MKRGGFFRNKKGKVRLIWWIVGLALLFLILRAIFKKLTTNTSGDESTRDMVAAVVDENNPTGVGDVAQKVASGATASTSNTLAAKVSQTTATAARKPTATVATRPAAKPAAGASSALSAGMAKQIDAMR